MPHEILDLASGRSDSLALGKGRIANPERLQVSLHWPVQESASRFVLGA